MLQFYVNLIDCPTASGPLSQWWKDVVPLYDGMSLNPVSD